MGCMAQGAGRHLVSGDVEACFASGQCDYILEGEGSMGGQEHFYLEPNAVVAVPGENDETNVWSTTQVWRAFAILPQKSEP